MSTEQKLPIWSVEAQAFIAYPCDRVDAASMPLLSTMRHGDGRVVAFHGNDGSAWSTDSDGRPFSVRDWSEQAAVEVADVSDRYREAAMVECRRKAANYRVLGDGIYVRSLGPVLAGSRIWDENARFVVQEIPFGPGGAKVHEFDFLLAAHGLAEARRRIEDAFPKARVKSEWSIEGEASTDFQTDCASLGAELAIWTFLCHHRARRIMSSGSVDVVVMMREFMHARYGDDDIHLDWNDPRPDRRNLLYAMPRRSDADLLDALQSAVGMLERSGGSAMLPLLRLGRDVLFESGRSLHREDVAQLAGLRA